MAKGILVKEPVQIGAKCALVLAHTAIFEDVARFRLSLESCEMGERPAGMLFHRYESHIREADPHGPFHRRGLIP